jgi:hypothetical protein
LPGIRLSTKVTVANLSLYCKNKILGMGKNTTNPLRERDEHHCFEQGLNLATSFEQGLPLLV